MKKKALMIFSISMILMSCRFEIKNHENTDGATFQKSELFGLWIQTNKIEDAEIPKYGLISKINLKDDFTAEIKILDSTRYKTVLGNWEIDKEQKIGPFSFHSDIVLTFDWNDQNRQRTSLSIERLNEKIVLTSREEKFERE